MMERTTTEPTVIRKAKTPLLALAIVLAMVLAAVSSALAQQGFYTATGVLEGPYTQGPDPEPTYRLTDEATGTTYVLVSGFVDLAPFVGERVNIEGARIGGADFAPPALNVTAIEAADGQTATATATAAASAQYATASPTASPTATASALPETGGGDAGLIALGAGALLVGGGLLARRIIR